MTSLPTAGQPDCGRPSDPAISRSGPSLPGRPWCGSWAGHEQLPGAVDALDGPFLDVEADLRLLMCPSCQAARGHGSAPLLAAYDPGQPYLQ